MPVVKSLAGCVAGSVGGCSTVVALVPDGRLLSSETSPPRPTANLPPPSAARRQEPAGARAAPDNRSLPAGLPPPRPTRAGRAGGQWRDCLTAWQSPRPPLFSASKGPNPTRPSTADAPRTWLAIVQQRRNSVRKSGKV